MLAISGPGAVGTAGDVCYDAANGGEVVAPIYLNEGHV